MIIEDLKELRNKLDRLIEKYEKEAIVRGDYISEEYRFEHDPRLADEEFSLEGDERLKEIGERLLKLKEKDDNDRGEKEEYPQKWEGNDIY